MYSQSTKPRLGQRCLLFRAQETIHCSGKNLQFQPVVLALFVSMSTMLASTIKSTHSISSTITTTIALTTPVTTTTILFSIAPHTITATTTSACFSTSTSTSTTRTATLKGR
eukprot:Rmarinus@m.48